MSKKKKISALKSAELIEHAASSQQPLIAALADISANYNERLVAFNLIEQLNHLCRDVQRHRGYSMGLLAGNESFLSYFTLLQEQMNRRIQLISAFVNRTPQLLNSKDLEHLHYAWNTIRDNWQEDSVLENFEFHSHFVDQLLGIIANLIDRVRLPYAKRIKEALELNKEVVEFDDESLYQRMLYFAHRELPYFIEMLGKVRALSVHAAAIGHCEQEYEKKLHYLLQCISQNREKVFDLSQYLQSSIADQLPSLLTIKTYEYKLDFLLEKVNNEILNKKIIDEKADDIFHFVTDIIDVYWRVVDDSLSLLHRWQQNDLEQWLVDG